MPDFRYRSVRAVVAFALAASLCVFNHAAFADTSNGSLVLGSCFSGTGTVYSDATISANITRWDIGRTDGSYINGNGHTMTKTGTGRLFIINVGDTNLGNVVVDKGDLSIQGNVVTTGAYCDVTVNADGLFSYWGAGSAIRSNVILSGGSVGCDDTQAGIADAGNGTYTGNISVVGSGGAAFNFGGGTLRLTAASTIAIPVTLTGTDCAAIVDTNGFNVTLSGDGGLTKLGSGVLTLTGTETFTGGVNIKAGTLVLTSTETNVATLDVETSSGAMLSIANGSHTIDSVTDSGPTVPLNGDAVIVVGTLVADSLVLGGATAEVTTTPDSIAAPEPSTLVALLVVTGFAALRFRRKR